MFGRPFLEGRKEYSLELDPMRSRVKINQRVNQDGFSIATCSSATIKGATIKVVTEVRGQLEGVVEFSERSQPRLPINRLDKAPQAMAVTSRHPRVAENKFASVKKGDDLLHVFDVIFCRSFLSSITTGKLYSNPFPVKRLGKNLQANSDPKNIWHCEKKLWALQHTSKPDGEMVAIIQFFQVLHRFVGITAIAKWE